jgi:DNA-binding MarR family transcriptional regulator
MYNEEASKAGGSMAIGFILLSLNPKKGLPSTSLGPKMGMESTSLSRTLKTMEESNLIKRLPNPNDGRGVLIELTTLGIDMRDASKEVVMKFNNVIIKKIGKKNISIFFNVMEEINKTIRNKEIF